MTKSIAVYSPGERDYIKVGERAYIFCLSHVRQEFRNRPVHTSRVLRIRDNGVFETLNTIYKPGEYL